MKRFIKFISPPYNKISIIIFAFLMMVGLTGVLFIVNQQTNLRSKAAGISTQNGVFQEAEDTAGVITGTVSIQNDSTASGGKYVLIGALGGITPTTQPTTPIPTLTPTPLPISTPISTPTPAPTAVPTASPTPAPNSTFLSVNLLLHGIGSGGDSVNLGGTGNINPLHTQRQVKVEAYNGQNQQILAKDGTVNFNQTNGNFTGAVDIGNTIPGGTYLIKVKSNQFLRAQVPGFYTINPGSTTQLSQVVLIAGDINGDNRIDILDYNLLIDCYSDLTPARNCTDPAKKVGSDITDDGNVNQFDYNVFLRELTNIVGL